MRPLTVALLLLAALAFPPAAHALELELELELDTEPTAAHLAGLERGRAIVAGSLLPYPPDYTVPVSVDEVPCGGAAVLACASLVEYPDGRVEAGSMSIAPTAPAHVWLHETAHAAVEQYLTQAERADWTALMERVGLLPLGTAGYWDTQGAVELGGTQPAGELFAYVWADCAQYRTGGREYGWADFEPFDGPARELACSWLYDLAAGKGWPGGESPAVRAIAAAAASEQARAERAKCIRADRRWERHELRHERHRRAHHAGGRAHRPHRARKHRHLKRAHRRLKARVRAACA